MAHPSPCNCPWHKQYTIDELLARGSHTVKHRLIEEGFLENRCIKCGIGPEWQGESLVLELDHIDGIRTNWAIDNLRMLCPNCHSQTPTFRGRKHKGKAKTAEHRRAIGAAQK